MDLDITKCLEKKDIVALINKNKEPSKEGVEHRAKEKRRKHRNGVNPKRKRTNFNVWKDVIPERMDLFPENIDGTRIIITKFNPGHKQRMKSTQDRRRWGVWFTCNVKGFAGVRRKATCLGSHVCINEECGYRSFYGKPNNVIFDSTGKLSNIRFVDCFIGPFLPIRRSYKTSSVRSEKFSYPP